jgi:hypothetical protein
MTLDYTTFTEVDSEGDVTVTASKCDCVDYETRQGPPSYIYYDYGVGHFDEDYQFNQKFYTTSDAASTVAVIGGMSNEIGNVGQASDAHFVFWHYDNLIYLRELNGGSATSDTSVGVSLTTEYWYEFERDESIGTYGTIYLRLYDDEAKTSLVDTLAVTLTEKQDFRYMYPLSKFNTNSATAEWTGYVADLVIVGEMPTGAYIPNKFGGFFGGGLGHGGR